MPEDKDVSDHDLLVRLNTKMDIFIEQQYRFQIEYKADSKDIVQRVTALEVNQASNVASIKSNKEDLDEAKSTLKQEIGALRSRGNWFDGINAAATAVVGTIALFFGGTK